MTRALAGLYLPQLRMDFDTICTRVGVAEDAGFHSAWFMDHLAPPAARSLDCFEGWTLATAVAMRTSSIRIGHLVLDNEFRHPALLAKMAATLDVLSGGRLELGIGWGSVQAEHIDYGFGDLAPAPRASRLEESLDIITRLWSGEPVTFDGKWWTLNEAVSLPRPVAGRVPVHIGGAGERLTMPLVARYADWWNCPSYGFERFDALRPHAGAARVSMQHPIALAPSAAQRDEVIAVAERRFGSWGGLIAGTPDEVAAALRAEAERGVELFVCQFTDFGRPETIRLFAAEVLPALS